MSDPVVRMNAALADRFVIERELGKGGMAMVYLADEPFSSRKKPSAKRVDHTDG